MSTREDAPLLVTHVRRRRIAAIIDATQRMEAFILMTRRMTPTAPVNRSVFKIRNRRSTLIEEVGGVLKDRVNSSRRKGRKATKSIRLSFVTKYLN